MKLNLTKLEHDWVRAKWSKIRASQRKADDASRRWNQINDEIKMKLEREGEVDIVQIAKIKGASIPLKDALSTHKWHAEESQRHIDDLGLFLKMKELGLL